MKRIISLILVLCLPAAALFSGCNNESAAPQNEILLYDFETYNPDFMALHINTNFGRVDVNTDASYVKSGTQSAKLSLLGGFYHIDQPKLTIPFYSSLKGFNYKELSKYQDVGISVYNAEDFVMPLYWNFTFFDGQSSFVTEESLQPGWNELKLNVQADMLNMFYDLTDCSGIQLGFEDYSMQGYDFDDAPTVYLDDVRLYPRVQAYEKPGVDIVVDPYEICSFEKAYQAYILKAASSNAMMPETKVVGAEGSVQPTQGEKMLKAEFPKGSGGYARLSFSPRLFPIIDFTQFKDEPEKYKIAYDIYNATPQTTSVATYYIWGGIKEWPNSKLAWGVNMEADNTTLPKNTWVTYEISLAEIYEWDKRTLDEEFHMFLMFNDNLPAGSVFYLDHFRIVKCA